MSKWYFKCVVYEPDVGPLEHEITLATYFFGWAIFFFSWGFFLESAAVFVQCSSACDSLIPHWTITQWAICNLDRSIHAHSVHFEDISVTVWEFFEWNEVFLTKQSENYKALDRRHFDLLVSAQRSVPSDRIYNILLQKSPLVSCHRMYIIRT